MPCDKTENHGRCYAAKHNFSGPCDTSAVEHYVWDGGTRCYSWCDLHARRQGYRLAGGQTVIGWTCEGSTPATGAPAPKAAPPLPTKEPPCTCPMFVGACVSIGHRADCAYAKWNQARLAAKQLGVPLRETPKLTTADTFWDSVKFFEPWQPNGERAQKYPDFKTWPRFKDAGLGRCQKCHNHRSRINEGDTIRACITCKAIYTDCI